HGVRVLRTRPHGGRSVGNPARTRQPDRLTVVPGVDHGRRRRGGRRRRTRKARPPRPRPLLGLWRRGPDLVTVLVPPRGRLPEAGRWDWTIESNVDGPPWDNHGRVRCGGRRR